MPTRDLLHTLIEKIIAIADYFVYRRHLTLSEAAMLSLASGRVVWMFLFGLNESNKTFDYVFDAVMWGVLFGGFTALHYAAFLIQSFKMRGLATGGYSVVWFSLGIVAALSNIRLFAVPAFFTFAGINAILSARLFREGENEA